MNDQKKKKVVVFGSIVHDLISYTERFPRPGESIRGKSFQQGAGGKGANQAVAAALIGADVTMIGRVGDDLFADFNISSLQKAGVDTGSVAKCAGKSTATATITVADDGENSIVVVLGANLEMTEETAEKAEEVIKSGSILLCQAEIDEKANRKAFEIARKHGVTTFFNPAPGDPKLDASILSVADIVCTNENEAEFITGISSPTVDKASEAALRMLDMGPRVAIVTLGPKGVVVAERKNGDVTVGHVPVEQIKAVDTTGAGDCFCGSLAAILASANGKVEMKEAVKRAAGLASLSVLKKGTQCSYSTRDEVIAAGKGALLEGI